MKRMLPHGPPADERLLLTVPEAARTLGIGTTLAYEMVGRGELPHVRLGHAVRVPRQALEAWIEEHTHGMPRKPGSRI
ncbi:MAG TPA: hypothetical protein DCK98_15810 [Chloroflexi bacterium]|jgi:excisionase family DNA binding protein|nr:hypothetical protein [Chloroflexota bacterium]HAL25623.1 hypothetical protein [Chloroflexota bacterium]